MTQPHVLEQLDAYLDGELDLGTCLAIEKHLEACPACRMVADGRSSLIARIQSQSSRYSAPDTMRRRIQKVIAAESRPATGLAAGAKQWAIWAASIILVAGLTSGTTAYILRQTPAPGIEEQVVSSHVRSLLVEGRLTDVASSDEHTVKPWFNHRLDFAPPVDDWTARGFPLVGGRLDYVDRHTVAALVYRHRQHLINLFIWPDASRRSQPISLSRMQGYAVVHWSDGAMTYWAVSDLNAAELKDFSEALRLAAKPS